MGVLLLLVVLLVLMEVSGMLALERGGEFGDGEAWSGG